MPLPSLDSPGDSPSLAAMLAPDLISLLRCPATRQPLRLATDEEKLQRQIPVEEPALITLDGARLYRTEMDLPILLSATDEMPAG